MDIIQRLMSSEMFGLSNGMSTGIPIIPTNKSSSIPVGLGRWPFESNIYKKETQPVSKSTQRYRAKRRSANKVAKTSRRKNR